MKEVIIKIWFLQTKYTEIKWEKIKNYFYFV